MPLKDVFNNLDEKQKKILVSTAVILLVVLIGYKLIYQSAVKKVNYYNSKYHEETSRNELRRQIEKLDRIREKYEALILQKQDIDTIKNEFSKLAIAAGVRITSISSSDKGKQPQGYNMHITVLEVEGTYHSIGRFLAKIESNKPYMGIRNLEIGNASEGLAGMLYEPGLSDITPAEARSILSKDTVVSAVITIGTYTAGK
ncbi:MAG: type 4a pilus biogenesis protein PilO [Candidatus Omnitrophica bacterium]|nr:type 4a pilus biogenesis protein PilO [Candidatus Omnitrophota bacterium]